MPNGGSDCCGTCNFNRANGGQAGYRNNPDDQPSYCEIRDSAIETPFWTYCANHPHHNPERIDVPVGPIYVCDSYPYTRRVDVPSPDTPDLRARLIQLLESMPETPRTEYPSATRFDEQVIDQLMAFRERGAVPGLLRVLRFEPLAQAPGERFGRDRTTTIGHAIEALAVIASDEALDEIRRCLQIGLCEARSASPYNPEDDDLAAIRYHAVRGLEHCHPPEALAILQDATTDPHPEVAAFAVQILASKRRPHPA